jgi:hypothetical protein
VTYYGRADNEHVDLHLALVVEGIPYVFVTRTIPGSPTALSGYTQVVCMNNVREGEAVLDLDERRETASTLDIDLLDTDDDLFLTLFAAAARPVGWVSTSDANEAADTLIYVNDASVYTADDVVYIGDETLIIDTVDTGADSIDTQRGAYGSAARDGMTGDTSTGDNIYTTPPHWIGRRAKLYGYAVDAGGLYTETLLGTYIVDASPAHKGGKRWSLVLAGVAQEYFERVVGLGMQQATFTDVGTFDFTGSEPEIEIAVSNARAFRTSATMNSHVIASTDFGVGVHKLTAVDVLGTITLSYESLFTTTNAMQSAAAVGDVRQVAIVQGPRSSSILTVLLSNEGQEVSGGDYLPGRAPSDTSDLGWRLGAGFTTAEVDVDAFDELANAPPMTIIIDGEQRVTEILREWCYLSGCAIITTADGKIKPISIGGDRDASPRTISRIVPEGVVEATHDETTVYPILKVKAGYSPITGDFHDEVNLVDADLAKRYRRAPQTKEIKIRSIDVYGPRLHDFAAGWRHPTRVHVAEFATMISDAVRVAGTSARRLVRLSLPHEYLDLRLGDVVTLSSDLPDAYDQIPNMRGGTLGGSTCRVVSRRPRYDQARVDVQLEILDRLLHVCPAAVISSVGTPSAGPNGGTVLTLATTGPEVSGASPGADFYAGAFVTIVDRSSPGGTETLEVLATSATIVEIEDAGFTIQAGVDYIVLAPENSVDGTTGSGYALVEFAKLANDAGVAGTNPATDTEPRWR